jgi:glycosyltransferase involved in cell wall biosynthesis
MPRLRIGVNALYLIPGGVGGTEIYLRNLLQALSHKDRSNTWYVFTNRETGADILPRASNFVVLPQPVHATSRPLRLLWEQLVLPVHTARLRLDCLFNPGFTAPAMTPCPNVTVFHDLQHKQHPEHFGPLDLPAWNLFLGISARRSRVFLADSEATKADLIRHYGIAESRVRVAWLGVEDEFFSLAEWRHPIEPYILCVSTLHPHKNIERLVRVFAAFRARHPEFRLVLAGMRGFRSEAVERTIEEAGVRSAVRVTGWVPRREIYELYRHAAAFVYPSTFEGFGLPVLEALAAGVPLACSDIEPLRSIVGDVAVRFDPHSDEDMLRALESVLRGEADVRAGVRRARQFTWERCAEVTLSAIEEASER